MARVQCFECEMTVVIDPEGRCPEGHDLGQAGARIEQSLGRAQPHPDEPEPWVAALDAPEASHPATVPEPRVARPISVLPDYPASAEDDAATSEGLLQELHALHGLGDGTPDSRPSAAAPSEVAEAPQVETGQTETPRVEPGDRSAAEAPRVEPGDRSAAGGPVADAPRPAMAEPDEDAPTEPEPDLWTAPTGSTRPADTVDDDAAPGITPIGKPTSEETLSAIAELSALFGEEPLPPAQEDDPAADGGSDYLAPVSRLPLRDGGQAPRPSPGRDSLPDSGPATDGSSQVAASGESIDWTNFTAKGKKRRR